MTGRSEGGAGVARLADSDVPDVVDVFSEAFRDYPVMRFILGGDASPARLRPLIQFFVSARSLRGEPLLGVVENERLVAAATVSFPSNVASPHALAIAREAVWERLGAGPRDRYETCGRVWKTFVAPEPHIHLNMIGVRPSSQGRGYARLLLDHVHGMSRDSPGSEGVTLTTEDPKNVAFYERAGYEITGHARVTPELETWGFFRRTVRG